jgi:alpha-beta hydrolase superfamily lysophospholipase
VFEYFPGNYIWNLALNIALGSGAQIGELDQACRAALAASQMGDDAGTGVLIESLVKLGDRLVRMAEDDDRRKRNFSAAAKFRRAAVYYATAERMHAPRAPDREPLYGTMRGVFQKFVQHAGLPVQAVKIPYGNKTLAGLFVNAGIGAPCMVHFDGFDAFKEILYLNGMADELLRRGVSTLIVDQPGVGEALRLDGMTVEPKAELPAAACVDYLETRREVDPARIGMMALSMGGYYAPRAAAFEKRFRVCVAWGANYDWGAVQRLRHENSKAGKPIPHFWEHFQWALGQNSIEEALRFADQINLRGVLHNITCPILITHGEKDRQIPLKYAQMTYDDCVNSPRRELKIHTCEEVASEHCSVDNGAVAIDYMADWIAEVLGGSNSPATPHDSQR